ncbi:hypothetical protein ACFQBQ_04165 [Granulicella cerasi]|uniref:Histidine phosphatase family protein n=1 Tax=Granulicella cerasi TaxID=741063 RepID=A0ABW1Z6M7_9BACT|nr:hypothetical protein [Granulicella cerasi]
MRFGESTGRWIALCGMSFLMMPPISHAAQHAAQTGPPNTDETIVMIRHGEKPVSNPAGQLNCQGLNRALALPAVLAKYGKPTEIFAPDPADQTTEGNFLPFATKYSYIRPLITIEPYAIALGMPVNAQIGATHIGKLQAELLKPEHSHALIVVSWEHLAARKFAEEVLSAFGQSPGGAPHWHNSDYDTIYIFHITSGADGKRKLDFRIEDEKLATVLPTTCPLSPVPISPAVATAPVPAGTAP